MINDSNFWNKISNQDNLVILLEGTRQITAEEFNQLSDLGKKIRDASPNSIFRSGNAPGTDTAFMEKILNDETNKVELILPFKKHRNKNLLNHAKLISLDDLFPEEIEGLKEISNSANPERESLIRLYRQGKKSLLSVKASFLLRDVLKVKGNRRLGLESVSIAIFFTNKNTQKPGGTGYTIKICEALNVDHWIF